MDEMQIQQLHKAKKQLESLKDKDKVDLVRRLPWVMQKKVYKLIARKSPESKCVEVIDALKLNIDNDPETAEKYKYQRTLDYFVKMLTKYGRV